MINFLQSIVWIRCLIDKVKKGLLMQEKAPQDKNDGNIVVTGFVNTTMRRCQPAVA